jgi:hypothetical protein
VHASDPIIVPGYFFILWILMMILMDYDFYVICYMHIDRCY